MAEKAWHGLVSAAAEAQELFGDDELERFAGELHLELAKRAVCCDPYTPLSNASAFDWWQDLGGEA